MTRLWVIVIKLQLIKRTMAALELTTKVNVATRRRRGHAGYACASALAGWWRVWWWRWWWWGFSWRLLFVLQLSSRIRGMSWNTFRRTTIVSGGQAVSTEEKKNSVCHSGDFMLSTLLCAHGRGLVRLAIHSSTSVLLLPLDYRGGTLFHQARRIINTLTRSRWMTPRACAAAMLLERESFHPSSGSSFGGSQRQCSAYK